MHQKVRRTQHNHAEFAAWFSKCFRALRNKGLTLKHENVLCWLANENAYG